MAGPETRPASSGEQQLPDLLSAPPLGDGEGPIFLEPPRGSSEIGVKNQVGSQGQ